VLEGLAALFVLLFFQKLLRETTMLTSFVQTYDRDFDGLPFIPSRVPDRP